MVIILISIACHKNQVYEMSILLLNFNLLEHLKVESLTMVGLLGNLMFLKIIQESFQYRKY